MRTHTKETPYKCDTCSAQFLQSSDLKLHVRTHTGEKHCKCDTCGAQFADRRDLNTHTRIHTGEKPYKGETCDAKGSQMCSLNDHETSVQYSSMQFNYTEQEAARALGSHHLIEVGQGIKTDPDEHCRNREVPRQWAAFPGGMLKEFKPEDNLQNLNTEVPRSWVVSPGGALKEVKTEHNE